MNNLTEDTEQLSNDEIVRKMQDMIRKKHLKKDEDAIIITDDGRELKVGYVEDE